jgi:hypothetical protein
LRGILQHRSGTIDTCDLFVVGRVLIPGTYNAGLWRCGSGRLCLRAAKLAES